jgi:cysteine desulfurase/selenocysteine lyase
VIPINDQGEIAVRDVESLIGPRTRIVSIAHVSNALGTVNPIGEIVKLARAHNVPVFVDGAQGVPHGPVDVQQLGCDFYAFSGHKAFGPTGSGALYGRADRLEAMRPFQGGGDMIRSVTFEKTEYADPPARFEAGTPHISGAIGLAVAFDYVESIGWDLIKPHEADLLAYATGALSAIPGVRLVGTAKEKASVISFVLDGVHPHDLGTIVDQDGVAIRTGHHCAQPVMERFGIPATARASLAFYNNRDDVDALVASVGRARKVFG